MAETATASSSNQGNAMAMVAYILTWITGLIVLLTAKKEDKFTRFHAIQAIGLGIAFFVIFLLWQFIVVGLVFGTQSGGVAATVGMISMILWLLVIVAIILCCVKAYQGQKFMLPVIGPIAEKNA